MNPAISQETSYGPGCSDESTNNPLWLVATVWVIPVAVFLAVTLAPATTESEVSNTDPVSWASVWALAAVHPATVMASETARLRRKGPICLPP